MASDTLTSTSFAVLGLLASGPRSAYELTEQLKTSAVAVVWPRSRSSLYREPKRLVEAGLAIVRRDKHLGPERSVYSITAPGRSALEDWLASPSAMGQIEDEALLKICFIEHADRAVLFERVAELRVLAARRPLEAGLGAIRERGLSSPERAHISLLTLRFMFEFQQATLRWCSWVEELAGDWPNDLRNLTDASLQHLTDAYMTLAEQMLEQEEEEEEDSPTVARAVGPSD